MQASLQKKVQEENLVSMTEGEEVLEISKRKAKKEVKGKAIKASKETFLSVDGQVQHTNDDSVVSKRSAVAQRYFEDNYLRLFVKAKARRSPLINRGYYLRMKVMDDIVTKSISILSKTYDSIQVVSLGAGYDTYAFRCLLAHEQKENYAKKVQFFDVDFPAVMKAKATLMLSGEQHGISFPSDWKRNPNDATVVVQGPSYCAVGVDLRNAEEEFIAALKRGNASFNPTTPTIFYAECVLQYMSPKASSALIRYVAATFPNAVFFSYDQIHPRDTFGNLMKHSLKTRGCPLLGIDSLHDGDEMMKRMLDCGMTKSSFANFFDLSRHYIDAQENERLIHLESFDEVEEWSEMCEHYGITMGQTLQSFPSDWHPCFLSSCSITAATGHEAFQHTRCCSPVLPPSIYGTLQSWPSMRFRFERWGYGDIGVIALENGDMVFVSFGGFSAGKNHRRINSLYCYSVYRGEMAVVMSEEGEVPPPFIFHSFTKLSSSQFFVFGGRKNPSDVSSKAYLLTLSGVDGTEKVISATWEVLSNEETTSFPSPRFRHAAVLCKKKNSIFVFGGKGVDDQCLSDSWMGTVDIERKLIRWRRLMLWGDVPPPSCSSAAVLREDGKILLSGGLTDHVTATGRITCIDVLTGRCTRGPDSIGGRFSHSMVPVTVKGIPYIFVLHGSTSRPKKEVQEAILIDPYTLHVVYSVTLATTSFWWSRHSCIPLQDGIVALLGGGYTCFSFGTAASRPHLLCLEDSVFTMPSSSSSSFLSSTAVGMDSTSSTLLFPMKPVETLELSREVFEKISNAAKKPVLFKKVDLGDCVSKWKDYNYLIAAEKGVTVSVHVAEGSAVLDFVRKNFTHRHVTFEELIQHVRASTEIYRVSKRLPDEVFYFRSISSHMKTERSNIWKDFPTIGRDFRLPCGIEESILPRLHQACWRINASPLSLWMHYDTLDNVLCQIVGRKKVTLFPPSQYNNLYMVNSSSSVLSVANPDLSQFPKFIEAIKHGFQTILEPGDMIFIPALWFHHLETIESEDDYSISVNVFYEHHYFSNALYDKKDLYGNKDLPVFSSLRSDVLQIVSAKVAKLEKEPSSSLFSNTKYTAFALREAIQDLETLATTLEAKYQLD